MINKIGIIFVIFFLFNSEIFAQGKVKFVKETYNVPPGCEKVSDYEISCGPFEMSWLYVEKGTIENILFETIKKIENGSTDFQYRAIRLLIDTVPASGFVTSFRVNGTKIYQLYAAGVVRGQSVLIQCMDFRPFWRYEDANPLFKQLITILPDKDKMKVELDINNPPRDTIIEDPYIFVPNKK